MAAQLKDKGHPALQSVPADRFGQLLDACKTPQKPSARLLKLVANGKKSLKKN